MADRGSVKAIEEWLTYLGVNHFDKSDEVASVQARDRAIREAALEEAAKLATGWTRVDYGISTWLRSLIQKRG